MSKSASNCLTTVFAIFFLQAGANLSYAGYTEYVTEVLADNPVNYWHLNESVPTDPAADVGPGGVTANNGVYNGGVTLQQSGPWPVGFDGGDRAIRLDGSTGFVQSPTHAEHNVGDGDFTLEMWLLKDAGDTANKFAYNQRLDGDDFISITYHTQHSIGAAFPNGSRRLVLEAWVAGQQSLAVSGAENLFDELTPGWHHIAFTVDRDNHAANSKLYVDGVDATLGTMTGAQIAGDLSWNVPANIGQWGGGGSRWDGMIDEVALYKTALSGDRIAAHYAAGIFPVPEPSSFALGSMALGVLGLVRRRRSA